VSKKLKSTNRFITTKREHANNKIRWLLGHYDELDRTLLSEAVRVQGLTAATNHQWNEYWSKRGFDNETDAQQHAARKGMPNIVNVWHNDVEEALRLIGAGEA
jgi:hypothetical protein